MTAITPIAASTDLRALSANEVDSVAGGTVIPPFSVPDRGPVNRYYFGPLLGAVRTIKLG